MFSIGDKVSIPFINVVEATVTGFRGGYVKVSFDQSNMFLEPCKLVKQDENEIKFKELERKIEDDIGFSLSDYNYENFRINVIYGREIVFKDENHQYLDFDEILKLRDWLNEVITLCYETRKS